LLLSPANLSGKRGAMILSPKADFAVARELRSAEGASIGDVFSFVSGLYFRGKASYARTFAYAHGAQPAVLVISAGGGLCSLDERITPERLRGWAAVSITEKNPHFTAPLLRHASALLNQHDPETRFVLLGSVASKKYVAPLLDIFGERLLFPPQFAGLGDMSRGALLLRAVREQRELAYAPVAGATLHRAARPK
jgi:hypothetical protein